MKIIGLTILLALSGPLHADNSRVNRLLENVSQTVGEYHQATLAIQTSPSSEVIDLEKHDRSTTLSIKALAKDTYLLETFTPSENESSAKAITLKRVGDRVVLTHLDVTNPQQSYTVEATVSNSMGTELSYYQSEVKYLDNSVEAVEARKNALQKRQLEFATVILLLTLSGENIPAEVIENEDWINVFLFSPGENKGVAVTEVLLDPRGKSERRPKGEPSLTILQPFHQD